MLNPLPPHIIKRCVELAFSEDLGSAGDITTAGIIPPNATAKVRIVARQPGIIAGMEVARFAFASTNREVSFTAHVKDAEPVQSGTVIAEISGPATGILIGERTALNFLGHLSGIATLTEQFVQAIKGTKARICCTRKTTPGLRAMEKFAVRAGGGINHRFGLDDAVLIKDNHIAVAGGIIPALCAAKSSIGHMVRIEIEVDTLDQLAEAMEEGVDVVMLDNMAPENLRQAVAIISGRAISEASGGVNLASVRAIAETGVDMISVGAITHSAPTLDLGLDFVG
jgi:nicotinate-nucleotide pyrophosphorylase (carboxylating)